MSIYQKNQYNSGCFIVTTIFFESRKKDDHFKFIYKNLK